MNLILAVVWLLLALFCFLVSWERPDTHLGGLLDFKVSTVGWIAVVLCGYNVVRWWSMKAAYRRRQPAPPPIRQPPTPGPSREPDPNFDFTERTPRRPPDTPSGP